MGNAIYFFGSFVEGNNWATPIRGEYSNGGWTVTVTVPDSGSFEWKTAKGSYEDQNASKTWSTNNNCKYPGTTSVTPIF